jgi:hypothetical protein
MPDHYNETKDQEWHTMPEIISSIITRGDLGHLALFLWAGGASFMTLTLVKELTAANRRFDTFVRELARFNNHISSEIGEPE